MAVGILTLPEELRCNIARFLHGKDNCALRLTCKELHDAATEALFSFVRLYPTQESIRRYNTILEHPDFSRHVKHVELNTLDKGDREEEYSAEAELDAECFEAFQAFGILPNLTGVTLRFSENSSSGNDEWSEWPQTYSFRQPITQEFFKTLSRPSASRIKDVTVDNIQNMNDATFMQSDTAVNVLSSLTALRLYIAAEYHEASPENNIHIPELHKFMAELRPLWLEPASTNLTTLVLYQSFYFGFCPKLDLRGLKFPNLHTLGFGNYVFTHDWQLDWLSSHSSTLQNLYLDDCIVVFYAKFNDEVQLGPEDYPVVKPRGPTGRGTRKREYLFYDQTWSHIFRHFRAHLSSLRHFRVGHSTRWGRWDEALQFHPSEYEDLAIGLFPDRYQIFDMGIGPCQYTEWLTSGRGDLKHFGESDGKDMVEGRKAFAFLERLKEQGQEDRAALIELLEAIGQPLPQDEGRVTDLMGSVY